MKAVSVTLERAARAGIKYAYRPQAKEPFTAIEIATGREWTRDNGASILRLITELTQLKEQGQPLEPRAAG
jgi:hypothetical protein